MEEQIEKKITSFFAMIEKEVQAMEYGTITVNVLVTEGLPNDQTTNLVKSKRRRYKTKKIDKSTEE